VSDGSSSEFSFSSNKSSESFKTIYSSTYFEVLNDDIQSISSVTSKHTLKSFSSFENLSINSENSEIFMGSLENFEVNSEQTEDLLNSSENFAIKSENLVQNVENLSTKLENIEKDVQYSDNFAEILIEKIFNFVIQTIFNNNLKPYFKHNKKSKKIFEKIVKEIHKKCQIEEIFMKNIFQPQNRQHWHQLLIACVPKICTVYAKNEERLQESKEKFQILFDFYQSLKIEFQNHLNLLKLSSKVAKINKKFGTFDEISKLSQKFNWNNSEKFKKLKIFEAKSEDEDFCDISFEDLNQNLTNCPRILLTNSTTLTMIQILQEKCENFLIFVDFENFLSESFQNKVRELLRHAYLVVSVDLHDKILENRQNFEVMSTFSDRILFIVEADHLKLMNDEKLMRSFCNLLENCNYNDIKVESEVTLAPITPNSSKYSESTLNLAQNSNSNPKNSDLIQCSEESKVMSTQNLTYPKAKDNDNSELSQTVSKLPISSKFLDAESMGKLRVDEDNDRDTLNMSNNWERLQNCHQSTSEGNFTKMLKITSKFFENLKIGDKMSTTSKDPTNIYNELVPKSSNSEQSVISTCVPNVSTDSVYSVSNHLSSANIDSNSNSIGPNDSQNPVLSSENTNKIPNIPSPSSMLTKTSSQFLKNFPQILHNFTDFDKKTKESFFKKTINLQGKKVRLSEIIKSTKNTEISTKNVEISQKNSEIMKNLKVFRKHQQVAVNMFINTLPTKLDFKNLLIISNPITDNEEKLMAIFYKIVDRIEGSEDLLDMFKLFADIYDGEKRKILFEYFLYFQLTNVTALASKKDLFEIIFTKLNENDLQEFFTILETTFTESDLEFYLNYPIFEDEITIFSPRSPNIFSKITRKIGYF